MRKLKTEPKKQILRIPFSLNQTEPEVLIKRWVGNEEQYFTLVFKTANSYVSHSLSYTQMRLLKRELLKQNI